MSELTIATLMSRMPKALIPEKVVGVDAVIQYHLTGQQAGDWIVTIRDGVCTVEPGVAETPHMTLSADSEDYLGIFTGETNAMQAFMEGKIKLAGDLNIAMKLTSFFKMT